MKPRMPAEDDASGADARETALIHLGRAPEEQHGYVNMPPYRGSTVLYRNVAELRDCAQDPLKRKLPAYGRFGSPNSRAFEAVMSTLEGGFSAVATNSGLSAVTTALLGLVRAGDHILVSDSVYRPTRAFCDSLGQFGVECEYHDPCLGSGIAALLRPHTRLVFMESPGSMTFEVQDVPAISALCRERGITTLIDNTWATPLFFRPLALGVDVSIHSASKYITGHADSLLGVVVCNERVYSDVRKSAIRLGQCAGADDAYLGLRGLKTLAVRLRHHQRQAHAIAQWLEQRAEVADVLYPALCTDAGHALWKRDFTGASGLFGVLLREHYNREAVDEMIDGLRLFGLGNSWGGFESLLVPVDRMTASASPRCRGRGELLRIHVGLEDVADLKADLAQGLGRLSRRR